MSRYGFDCAACGGSGACASCLNACSSSSGGGGSGSTAVAQEELGAITRELKEYARWGRIEFIDSKGETIETQIESKKSKESNPLLKWYEEKTSRYIAYEAAAKKFLPEEDLDARGKCSIMSFLTTESQIEAKINEA